MEKVTVSLKEKSSVYDGATVISRTPVKEHGYVIEKVLIPKNSYCGNEQEFEMEYALNENGDYIGSVEDAKYICEEKGIRPITTEENSKTCSIGKSVIDGKWYGWSHRAMYGFEPGSECTPGNCHYKPNTIEEYLDSLYAWYDHSKNLKIVLTPDKKEARITYNIVSESSDPTIVNKDIIKHDSVEPVVLGKGKWTAQTEEEAKQMAIDFSKSVSSSLVNPEVFDWNSLCDVYGQPSEFLAEENIPYKHYRADYLTHNNLNKFIVIRLSRDVLTDISTDRILERSGLSANERWKGDIELFGVFKGLGNITNRTIAVRMNAIGATKNGFRYKLIKESIVLTLPDYYPVYVINGTYKSKASVYAYSGQDSVIASGSSNLIMENGDDFLLEKHNNGVFLRKFGQTKQLEINADTLHELLTDSFRKEWIEPCIK